MHLLLFHYYKKRPEVSYLIKKRSFFVFLGFFWLMIPEMQGQGPKPVMAFLLQSSEVVQGIL
jgi:hypothetical protein